MSGSSDVNILYDPVSRMLCPFCREHVTVTGIEAFSSIECTACKRPITVPARLGSFLLVELLGTGGMGGVYRAHDETLGRDVAIKVMLKSLGDSPEFVQTFRREAQAAAKLNHPHIAQIYSFGQEKGQPYIVMELVPGKHFDTLIAAGEPLDPAMVMRIGADIAEGLRLASEAGLVHGDIKPENILLDDRDQAKLVDFGLAGNVNQSQGEIWGTPYYIAPEKVRRHRIDHRSDIYCLGGTLYHALAGRPPFEGPDALAVVKARFAGPPQPLSEIRPGLDPAILDIINRMLQLEPAMRYPTYESLLGDMRRYLSRVGPGTTSTGTRKMIVIKGKARKPGATEDGGKSTSGKIPPNTTSKIGRSKTLMVSRGVTSDVAPMTAANASANAAAPEAGSGTRRGRGCLIAALVAVALLVVGGAVAFGVIRHLKNKVETELLAAAEAHRAALTALDQSVRHAQGLHSNIVALAAEAAAAADEASRLVVGELGETWRDQIAPPAPPPVDAPPPDAVTNAAAVKPDGAATNQPAPAAASDQAAAPAPDTAAELPPLVAQAREVLSRVQPLTDSATRAAQVLEDVRAIAAAAHLPTNSAEQVQLAVGQVARSTEELEADYAAMPEKLRTVRDKLATVQKTVTAGATERARLEQERQRAEELRRQEAARQQREAELQARREAELAKVQTAETGQEENLRKHLYRDAVRAMRLLTDELQTEEARRLLEVRIERIQRLDELKGWLIERLAKGGFRAPAGWSVQSADPRFIKVDGKEVPWERVTVREVVPFIQFYLVDERQARDLKLRERVRQSLNAAVYCLTFGGGSAGARDMAARLVEKTIDLFPAARVDADRVVPELRPSSD